jgi:hypothetical protein
MHASFPVFGGLGNQEEMTQEAMRNKLTDELERTHPARTQRATTQAEKVLSAHSLASQTWRARL